MIRYSSLYEQFIVIHKLPGTNNSTISKFPTREMAEGFQDSLQQQKPEQKKQWWED